MEFQYKGLHAQLQRIEVTQEEIDRQVERLNGQDLPDMTPQELRSSVAQALQAHYDERAEEELLDRLIRQAAATLDYTAEEAKIEEAAQAQLALLGNQLAQRKLSVEEYCRFMDTSEEALLEDMRMDSAQLLRVQAAIDRIAELENITVSADELQAAYDEICRKNQCSLAQLQGEDAHALEEAVRSGLLQRKVLQCVRDAADISS